MIDCRSIRYRSIERVRLKHGLRRRGITFSKEDPTPVLEAKLRDGGFMGFTGD